MWQQLRYLPFSLFTFFNDHNIYQTCYDIGILNSKDADYDRFTPTA